MLLSFGMMAKSNHTINKVKHDAVKKHNVIAKKTSKTLNCACVPVTTSCGARATVCADNLQDLIWLAELADILAC